MGKREKIVEEMVFLDIVKQYNLVPLKVMPNVKLTLQLSCDEEDFVKLAALKTSEIYYFYEYPEDHEILITGKTFEEARGRLRKYIDLLNISDDFSWYIDKDIYPDEYADDEDIAEEPIFSQLEQQLKREILDYNRKTSKNPLHIPRRFMSFYIDSGCIIGILKEADKPIWTVAEDKLFGILSIHRSLIEEQMEAAEQHKLGIREKLRAYLMSDLQFKVSTNQKLRNEYARNLWFNKEFKWIQEGFRKIGDGYPPNEYFNFIERTYKEMKYDTIKRRNDYQ